MKASGKFLQGGKEFVWKVLPSQNQAVTGARFYNNLEEINNEKPSGNGKSRASPRDSVGHGTHTASIAAGAAVGNANYFGLANGTARGGLTSARIATYKACADGGCSGATILKAIDDAVKDGVDVISISIGMTSGFQTDFLADPIAIGAFHAAQRGVAVVCSAGNDGPDPYTVTNTAPWIFTVAASTIDRKFESTVVLGNGMSFKGAAISFSLSGHPNSFPLVFAENVARDPTLASDARNCAPGTLDAEKVAGKIIVCMNNVLGVSRSIKKLVVEDAGAKGLILIDDKEKINPYDSGPYPFAEVGNDFGVQILKYINSTKHPIATIFPAKEVQNIKQAPVVADFSSRGPAGLTEDILKPDIMAPGVAILAATIPESPDDTLTSTRPSFFSITSGTSMACPHVAGAVAFIKSVHPEWSSSMIKSAIMTTASISSNTGNPLTNSSNFQANPHEMGAGEINPIQALDPGLVFETRNSDYLYFLCYYGYKEKIIRAISKTTFECPTNGTRKHISNINFPSISIGKLGVTTVKRVATNVGPANAAYVSSIVAPKGLKVKVSPERIAFAEGRKKASFAVSFDGGNASKGYNFGAILWSDGSHIVRLVFAVNIE
nr:CO(2)-response secreted protease-like [Ipomoea batatas]